MAASSRDHQPTFPLRDRPLRRLYLSAERSTASQAPPRALPKVSRMRKFLVPLFVVAVVMAVVPIATATADASSGPSISVPVTDVVFGVPGSAHQLASVAVDAALQGTTCAVVATSENNESVHPGTTLVVSSGSAGVTIPDVESSPSVVKPATGALVLGPQIVVEVTLGPDGVFSGGVDVQLTCESPSPPTTAPPPTTTSPPPSTTPVVVSPVTVEAPTSPALTVTASPPVATAVLAMPQTTG